MWRASPACKFLANCSCRSSRILCDSKGVKMAVGKILANMHFSSSPIVLRLLWWHSALAVTLGGNCLASCQLENEKTLEKRAKDQLMPVWKIKTIWTLLSDMTTNLFACSCPTVRWSLKTKLNANQMMLLWPLLVEEKSLNTDVKYQRGNKEVIKVILVLTHLLAGVQNVLKLKSFQEAFATCQVLCLTQQGCYYLKVTTPPPLPKQVCVGAWQFL